MNETPLPAAPSVKPGKLQTVGILMLINGILNVIYNIGVALAAGISILGGAIATLGIGLCCLPLALIPLIPLGLGVFEIVYGAKLLSSTGEAPKAGTLQTIAILEIAVILFGNVVSLVIGIVNLVTLSDAEIKAYYGQS